MKRLFFLLICMFAVPVAIFAAEVGERAEIDEAARETKARLEGDQKDLKAMIEKQQEEVNKASQEQYEAENDKLRNMKIANTTINSNINKLSDYLDMVDNKEDITQIDLNMVDNNIKEAQKTIRLVSNLRSEFVSAQSSESQEEQGSQAQVEKLGLWDTFKLNVQSVFTQTKAALASFFGNTQAEAAAHKDLVDIYSQLQDYGNKAKSAGKLAGLYAQLNMLGNAIEAETAQIDALNNTPNMTEAQKLAIVSKTVADTFAFKDTFLKNQTLLPEALPKIQAINAKIDDFLAELGYKVNKVSAYEVLGVNTADTPDAIKEKYKNLIANYSNMPVTGEWKQMIEKAVNDMNTAMEELFGPNYANNLDLKTKEAYDKSTIVQQGFEVKQMDPDEKLAFQERKAQRATQQQTEILPGN